MKEWKHITLEQRKIIGSGVAHNYKVKDIAEVLGLDPTSISKEVKRNRDSITVGLNSTSCKRTQRWPYVCDGDVIKNIKIVLLQNTNMLPKKHKRKPILIL